MYSGSQCRWNSEEILCLLVLSFQKLSFGGEVRFRIHQIMCDSLVCDGVSKSVNFNFDSSEETKSTARLSGQGQGVTPLIELFLIFWFLVQECLSSKGVFRELLIWYRISFSSLVCRVLNLFSQEPVFLGTSAHVVSRSFLSESLSCYANLTQSIILIIIWRQIPTKETLLPKWLRCHTARVWVQKKWRGYGIKEHVP